MKDKNGIYIECQNCASADYCKDSLSCEQCPCQNGAFLPSVEAYEARIAELKEAIKLDLKSVNIDDINATLTEAYEDKVKELEENFLTTAALLGEIAQERDELREEVQNLKKENERLSKEIIDLGTGTLAEKNYQSAIKQIQNPSESFYQKYSGVSEEYALGALEQCATEADELQARVKDLESKLTETIKLLGERSRECGELQALLEVKNRSDMSTQSTDAADVSKKIREMDMRNVWWR